MGCLSSQNGLRKFCEFLHNVAEYSYVKCMALVAYAVFTFASIGGEYMSTSHVVLFVLDIWLLLDIFTQAVAYRLTG